MEGLGWLYVPSSLQVVITHLTTAGPAPDHTAWAQKGALAPHMHVGLPTAPPGHRSPLHCPQRQGPRAPCQGCRGSILGGWVGVWSAPRNTGLSPLSGWAEGPAGWALGRLRKDTRARRERSSKEVREPVGTGRPGLS